jgi:hypothetical protein
LTAGGLSRYALDRFREESKKISRRIELETEGKMVENSRENLGWHEPENSPAYQVISGGVTIRVVAQKYDPKRKRYSDVPGSAVRLRFEREADIYPFVAGLKERLA